MMVEYDREADAAYFRLSQRNLGDPSRSVNI